MKTITSLFVTLGMLGLVGCSKQEATVAPSTASQAAPAPANLTPEQKAAYDQAVRNAGPSATPPPTGGQ